MCIALCYMEDMENALSKALSELLRRTKGATQKKVGLHAGISQPYVSDLKNGDRDGGVELWEKISEYFGLAYDEFYNFGKQIIDAELNIAIPNTTPTPPQRRKTDIEIQADKDHEKLVGGFVHKDVAIDVNKRLLRLEELKGRDGLLEIKGTINQLIRDEEKKMGLDQGNTETGTES